MKTAVADGSSGNGKAVAKLFKDRESGVVAPDFQEPQFEAEARLPTDLSDPVNASEIVSKLEGPFAAWSSSAGLPSREGARRRMLAVNFLRLVAAARAAVPLLPKGGPIVNIASRVGAALRSSTRQIPDLLNIPSDEKLNDFIATEQFAPVRTYALSKVAVTVWSMLQVKSLIPPGIRINTVNPADVSKRSLPEFETPFGVKHVRSIAAQVNRRGFPSEVAAVVHRLASDRSR